MFQQHFIVMTLRQTAKTVSLETYQQFRTVGADLIAITLVEMTTMCSSGEHLDI